MERLKLLLSVLANSLFAPTPGTAHRFLLPRRRRGTTIRGLAMKAVLVLGVAALSYADIASSNCAPPPVTTAKHAICLARQYAERSQPHWELAYSAREERTHWLVIYIPANHEVRGGGGELKVEKEFGIVTFIQGYR